MIFVRKLWERRVRLGLVPKGDRCNIVHQRQISLSALPPERLNSDAQIMIETDGVRYMPAIETEALLRLIKAVRLDDLRETGVGRSESVVLMCFLIFKIIGAVEVVFCTGPVNGGELLVAIQEEFDFSFTP